MSTGLKAIVRNSKSGIRNQRLVADMRTTASNGLSLSIPGSRNRSPRHRNPLFAPLERRVVRDLQTPRQVQAFLRALPYNWEKNGETLRTLRGVLREGEAHCLEAALSAAAILEQHGYPPLLLDFESQDKLDHVVFLFRKGGLYGTVGRSRDAGLHGRRPVFRTIRDVVLSYVDPYVDGSGRIVGYGIFDLRDLKRCDWRLSSGNVWAVERVLIDMPHKKLLTSDRRYKKVLDQFLAFRERYPSSPVTFYSDRKLWM
jgi:hypothetical protein